MGQIVENSLENFFEHLSCPRTICMRLDVQYVTWNCPFKILVKTNDIQTNLIEM